MEIVRAHFPWNNLYFSRMEFTTDKSQRLYRACMNPFSFWFQAILGWTRIVFPFWNLCLMDPSSRYLREGSTTLQTWDQNSWQCAVQLIKDWHGVTQRSLRMMVKTLMASISAPFLLRKRKIEFLSYIPIVRPNVFITPRFWSAVMILGWLGQTHQTCRIRLDRLCFYQDRVLVFRYYLVESVYITKLPLPHHIIV